MHTHKQTCDINDQAVMKRFLSWAIDGAVSVLI